MLRAIIIMCLKTLLKDTRKVPVVDKGLVKHYLKLLQKAVTDYDEFFEILGDFLLLGSVIRETGLTMEPDDDDQERQWLKLVTALIGVTAQTEILREAYADNPGENVRLSQEAMARHTQEAIETATKTILKLVTAQQDLVLTTAPFDREAKMTELKDQEEAEISQLHATYFHATRPHLLTCRRQQHRGTPIGMDYFGNSYWHFQQRALDLEDCGSCIVIEKCANMPNSLQEPGQKVASARVKKKTTSTEIDQGTGELYYLQMHPLKIDDLIRWLEYQVKAFQHHESGGVKLKDLCMVTDHSIGSVIRYLKDMVKPACMEEEQSDEDLDFD